MDSVRGLLFRYRIWWHLFFWVFWYFFYTFTYSSGVVEKFQFINNLYLLPARMIATYLLMYWIVPFFLFRRKYLLFALLIVAHTVLFGMSISLILYYLTGFREHGTIQFIRPIVLNYQIPATAVAIYLFKRWYLIQQYTLNLEKEKLEAELKFLKSQIHPHFLFNTLNNLYALTLKKSDKAPEVVIQLSNLLEYSLYSGKETEVELSEELKLLSGYIDLEKLRFGNRLKIKTEICENVEGLLIAPLLLLPFVENSFKHGASKDLKSPFIELNVNVLNNQLIFRIINSYRNETGKFEVYKERIGLKNVKRRLELLYPKRHKLEIKQEENVFEVSLRLELIGASSKPLYNEI
jgi:two-component system, LytTR family, sensor kinase